MSLAKSITLIFLFFFTDYSYGAKYANLPICSFGVTNSKLTLIVEDNILVPALTQFSIHNDELFNILPFPGSLQALDIEKCILNQQKMTFGHIMPYIYIAINHAFDRIYFNSIINPRNNEDSLRRSMGFTANLNVDELNNLRDILSIKKIKNQSLTFEVYSSINSLKRAQKHLNYVSEEAFWDPDNHKIGFYINPKIFYWLPIQVDWENQSIKESITAVRNYISKILIQTISHEIVHFIHFSSGTKIYDIPFLAEASAIFLEENIAYREDVFQIAGALIQRNLPLTLSPKNTLCGELSEFAPPLYCLAMLKIKDGINETNVQNFNIAKLITLNEKEFYSLSMDRLKRMYNLALAFPLFALSIPRNEFKYYFAQLLNNKDKELLSKNTAELNRKFIMWCRGFAKQWENSPDTKRLFEVIQYASTLCLNNRDYYAAYKGANTLISIRPNSPIGWLYLGDVFWRTEISFFAFDYYARGFEMGKKHGFTDSSELRITSRLADGYEALGDIETAVKFYQDIRIKNENKNKLNPNDIIPFFRCQLKEIFYKELIYKKRKQSQAAFNLLNAYVNVLQNKGCPTDKEKMYQRKIDSAFKIYDWIGYEAAYREHFEEVKNRMLKEINQLISFEVLLEKNLSQCK